MAAFPETADAIAAAAALGSTDSTPVFSFVSGCSMLSSPFIKLARSALTRENHPAVQSSGAALAARPNAHGVSHALRGIAEADLLVAHESWKPHAVRLGLPISCVLSFSSCINSPPRTSCEQDLVCPPGIQQWGCHIGSRPCMGVRERRTKLGSAHGGKSRPDQGDCASHKRRRGACSTQGERPALGAHAGNSLSGRQQSVSPDGMAEIGLIERFAAQVTCGDRDHAGVGR